MGLRILSDGPAGEAVLYDSTTMTAIGPVMPDPTWAEEFIGWLGQRGATKERDGRRLVDLWNEFISDNTLCDECDSVAVPKSQPVCDDCRRVTNARRMATRISEKSATMDEYRKLRQDRDEAVSRNRSLRMRGQPAIPVPPKPERPMGYEVYIDGDYAGFHREDDMDAAMTEGEAHADGGKVTVKRKPFA